VVEIDIYIRGSFYDFEEILFRGRSFAYDYKKGKKEENEKSRLGSSQEFLRFLFKLNINYTTAPKEKKKKRNCGKIKAAATKVSTR
jgi:hypothetical protein